MDVDPSWLLAAGALIAGSLLQGFAGFGYGLLAVPLVLLIGFDLPQALAMLYPSALVQCAANSWQNRDAIPWLAVRAWMPWTLPGLAGGLALLHLVTVELPAAHIHLGVAILIIASALVQLLAKPQPRERIGRPVTALAATASGLLSATVGMGGPPLVLWCLAHDWPAMRLRTCIWAVTTLTVSILFVALLVAFGRHVWSAAVIGFVAAPLTVLAALAGGRLGRGVSTVLARRLAWALLLVIAGRVIGSVVI